MSNRILCIGEILIDLICSDINTSLVDGINFLKKAGGAPANASAAIAKLGGNVSFAGKVGNDPFGIFLRNRLNNAGVDTSMLILDKNSNTTMAFVSLMDDGERDFVFNRGADELLNYKELDEEKLINFKIVHFGSATALLGGELKKTYIKTMNTAKENGIYTSFDPNYRIDLWKNRLKEFIKITRECLKYIDFLKLSDEEMKIVSGKRSLEDGIKILHNLGPKIIAITLGKKGTFISNGSEKLIVNSINIKSIDSTGAGDAFVGAFLYKISQIDNPKLLFEDFEKIKEITYFSNKVGALTCTKIGAISGLPSLKEVMNYN